MFEGRLWRSKERRRYDNHATRTWIYPLASGGGQFISVWRPQ